MVGHVIKVSSIVMASKACLVGILEVAGDAQADASSTAKFLIYLGHHVRAGLGCGWKRTTQAR